MKYHRNRVKWTSSALIQKKYEKSFESLLRNKMKKINKTRYCEENLHKIFMYDTKHKKRRSFFLKVLSVVACLFCCSDMHLIFHSFYGKTRATSGLENMNKQKKVIKAFSIRFCFAFIHSVEGRHLSYEISFLI